MFSRFVPMQYSVAVGAKRNTFFLCLAYRCLQVVVTFNQFIDWLIVLLDNVMKVDDGRVLHAAMRASLCALVLVPKPTYAVLGFPTGIDLLRPVLGVPAL